jgi:hypothetical protein
MALAHRPRKRLKAMNGKRLKNPEVDYRQSIAERPPHVNTLSLTSPYFTLLHLLSAI